MSPCNPVAVAVLALVTFMPQVHSFYLTHYLADLDTTNPNAAMDLCGKILAQQTGKKLTNFLPFLKTNYFADLLPLPISSEFLMGLGVNDNEKAVKFQGLVKKLLCKQALNPSSEHKHHMRVL